MNTHTAGPWTIKDGSIIGKGEIFGRTVAIIPSNGPLRAEDKANAQVIAAAPALLHALQNLLADWERCHGRIPHDHEARAAIEQATTKP